MTSGTKNLDAFTPVTLDSGPTWVGLKWLKTWSGGDKVQPRSRTKSPRPPAPFAKRTKMVSAKRPYKGKKPQKAPVTRSPYVEVPRTVFDPPKPRKSSRSTQDVKGPYGGAETLRWSEVNRIENSRPKRADSEFHDYDMTLVIVAQEAGTFKIIDNPFIPSYLTGTSTFEGWHGPPVPSLGWTSNDDIRLLGKLRERVAGSDFNAGVFLGEGHKALRMIAENATRIYRAYSHVRKGDLLSAAKALGVSVPQGEKSLKGWSRPLGGRLTREQLIAQRWLELQYGWLPLLKDVYGGAEFLAHHLNVPLRRRTIARAQRAGSVTTGSPSNSEFTVRKVLTRKQIVAYISEKDVAQLSGLLDPASILWELTPLSFVADWFIPIGSWLAARGLVQSLKGEFVTTTTTTVLAESPRATGATLAVPSVYSYFSTQVERRVTETLTVPLPSTVPLSKALSWKRAANAVALLITAFSGNTRGLRDLTD